ncbi:MAG: class I SAM-dependent methyltransferase [Gammaproteobacteria bacterium]|nr:class I SAM-dependent methyltransferase [Gammaproteobacteria bacterium]
MMSSKEKSDKNRKSLEDRFSRLSPLKDTLHLLLRIVLDEIPEDSQVLVVGAGGGQELLYLADAFPNCGFTVVEPDASILETCVQNCNGRGISSRCTFHEGILDSLPGAVEFNAATSILVSHYLPNTEAKANYFRVIASRLVSKGILVGTDLITWKPFEDPSSLLGLWKRTMKFADAPVPPKVPEVSQREFTEIVRKGGFQEPVFSYQALLMNAWYTRKLD